MAEVRIAQSAVRSTELGDSAEAIVIRLFQQGRMVDTTDLRESLRTLQLTLEATPGGYCGEAIVLVTDGALAPFREPSGALPSPAMAVDGFIALVTQLQREKRDRFRYYAVSMGAARGPAIDRSYQRAWEASRGEITGEIAEMGGRDLLDRAFGRVYELNPNSLSSMIYRDTSSVYPTFFGLRREASLSLADIQDRLLRYLLVEQSVDEPSLCEARTNNGDQPFEWTLAGDRCMLHMNQIGRLLRDRIGGSSPWFMYADDFDAGSLPDTIKDPHLIVLREQGATGGSCPVERLFSAVNDGFSYDSAQPSNYSLHYRLIGKTGASRPSTLRLKRLPHSACLVAADLVGADPPEGPYDSIRFDVEVDDGRVSPVIFSNQRPWMHPSLVRWKLVRLQSIASSLVFVDRWIVSGSVVAHRNEEPLEGRVKIGANTYPLTNSTSENPCTIPGVYDESDPLQCLTFGGLYVAGKQPERALISFSTVCESSPGDCHFAELASYTPLLQLSLLQIVWWGLIGAVAAVLFELKRRKHWSLSRLFASERPRLGITVLIGAMLCTWIAEAVGWTPSFLPYHTRILESTIPTLWALALVVFPAQLIPFIRLLGLRK
jgi:hypothetical protein